MPGTWLPVRSDPQDEHLRHQPFVSRPLTPERLAALMDTRRELLEGLDRHPEWAEREAELFDLLKSVLRVEDLRLLRIDRHTPVTVLDKIVKYEAVHRIQDARDLERRLADDRRCYAFVHPALPDEPLIFTELALTHDMSSDAQALLDTDSPIADPATCTCAIFYSISSCHEGLKGVSLGNALIGQVADKLESEYSGLETFATLSPVPGFRAWLMNLGPAGTGGVLSPNAVLALATLERSGWPGEVDPADELERELVALCAYYLLRVKRGGEPADSVARFHLRNGARLERINWLSDTSVAGMRRAAGMMVNYLYRRNNPRRQYDAATRMHAVNASAPVEWLAGRASTLFSRSAPTGIG
jgi:malonyl-CoA decarboxylase